MIELNKIFANKNVKKGIELIRNLGIDKQIKLYDLNKLVYVNDIIGYWVQLDKENIYEYTTQEKNNIKLIRNILKQKKITNKEIYNYGLYICLVAAQILKINKEEIIEINKNTPIRSKKDIDISSQEIYSILNKLPGPWMKQLYDDLINQILDNKVQNNNGIIKNYIKNKYMI
jgi:hypothetical protein